MEPNSELVPRIGTFFYMVGIGLMLLFIGSAISGEEGVWPKFDYFVLSLLASFLGFTLRRKAAKPAPSDRFGMIRRAREKSKARKEKKQQKQQQQKQKK